MMSVPNIYPPIVDQASPTPAPPRPSPQMITLWVPADHAQLATIGAALDSMLCQVPDVDEPEVLAYNTQLAVHEACVNIMDHAYAGDTLGQIEIRLSLAAAPRRLIIELHDSGCSFDPTRVPPPNLETAQVHGYGLFLIYELLDEVLYTSECGHNYWQLVKYL